MSIMSHKEINAMIMQVISTILVIANGSWILEHKMDQSMQIALSIGKIVNVYETRTIFLSEKI